MDKKKQIGAHLMVHAEGCCMAKTQNLRLIFKNVLGQFQ